MELHIINQSTNLPGGLNVKWKHRIHLLSAVLSADFILLAYLDLPFGCSGYGQGGIST